MDKTEVFQILGIEETKDETRIKDAYRAKLSVTNPEDDPEGFKRLRSAYEEAGRLARESGGEAEEQVRDTTPSGLWVEKAAGIYDNIHTRQKPELWEELFMDDCFLSLEDEENCRIKLLGFLMEHFKLPTRVWKLLDKKLGIISGAAKLRERFPADFVRYVLNKCERGEDVEFSQFEGPEDGQYDLFLQFYDRTWQALSEENLEEAARCIESADKLQIRHPVLEICRGDLLDRQGRSGEAVAMMEGLLDKYPGDAMVGYNTAELLWRQEGPGRDEFREKAAKIYQSLKEANDSHYMANVRLTEWHCGKGEYREAKKCAERVLTSGADDAFMELLGKVNAGIETELEQEYRETKKWEHALELCWCYLQDGKISRGIRLAMDIEKQLPPEKEAEFQGLMAKLYVEEGEYEDSIAMTYEWEEALHKKLKSGETEEEKDRDRDRLRQASLIRMQCNHNLGFVHREKFGEAVREGKKVLTDSIKDVGILLELAQLYVEMEEYGQCLELVDRLVEEYQIFAAYATSLEAYRRQLDATGVVRSGAQCIRYFPSFVKAYEYMAKVYLDLDYREDLERTLEDAGKNGVKSDMLNAYRYQLGHKPMELSLLNSKLRRFREKYREPLERGVTSLYQEGLELLTEYLYNYPDSYMFVERGLYHKAAHHYEEAREDFEKAVSLEPANCYALNGLSQLCKALGDYEKALIYVRKAILYMGEEMSPGIYQHMGNLYSLLGDNKRALAAHMEFQRLTRGKKRSDQSQEEVAEAMQRMGQLDEAGEIWLQIYGQDAFINYFYRVQMYSRGGDGQKARELLKLWRKGLMNTWRGKFGMGINGPLSRCIRRIDHEMPYSDYFRQLAWVELLHGDHKKALRCFREAIACHCKPCMWEFSCLLEDAIFACILCGDDAQGRKYSEEMGKYLKESAGHPRESFFNEQKRKLYLQILSCFYTSAPQTLWELLDKEGTTDLCQSCTNPYCKELEGVRIILLCREGKQQEAGERLKRNLEVFPQDDYMLAVKRIAFGDRLS